MSKKRPFFKSRVGWTHPSKLCATSVRLYDEEIRVRVVDAREPTAEKAVERVLQGLANNEVGSDVLESVGMTATYIDGIVRVRKIKESKR